jgi:lipopolysaccharide transport system ATP-binding protein
MKPIIKVEGISKQYRIGARAASYDTLRDALAGAVRNSFKQLRSRSAAPTVWALKGIDFEVQPGEVLGLVGRNGAGKSTLLKILSRIVEPTTGRADLYGRVGSLLEVGTGFHPELTGRENVFLNGAMLGMKRAEITRKFDEIVAFSEIERFIDTPVKRYSSGMYTRLAFAVAAHLEPEILIVDEVLAVGDMAFQKKCLGKMGEVAQAGRTVLFVSHNMIAVQKLCNRVIWLKGGRIARDGQTAEVLHDYFKASTSNTTEQVWDDIGAAPGNERARLRRVCVRPAGGAASDVLTVQTPLLLEFEFWNLVPGAELNLSAQLFNEQDVLIFASAPTAAQGWHGRALPAGLFRSTCHIPGNLLNDGTCRLQLLVIENQATLCFQHDDALTFDINESAEMRAGSWHGKWPGVVRPKLQWSTELLETDEVSSRQVAHGT